jgi:hypothetical protein
MANGRWEAYAGSSRDFDRWLKANAVVGSILAIGMLAMAFAGLNFAGPPEVATELSSVNVSSE